VLRESGGHGERWKRCLPQPRQDFRREHSGVGSLPSPDLDGPPVRSVLGASELCGAPAVTRIVLFGA
jgi:hypothetical protein